MYVVDIDPDAFGQVEALPVSSLAAFAELRAVLEVAPWSGAAYNRMNPDGAMRTLTFGEESYGLVVYLVLEDQRRVMILRVLWLA